MVTPHGHESSTQVNPPHSRRPVYPWSTVEFHRSWSVCFFSAARVPGIHGVSVAAPEVDAARLPDAFLKAQQQYPERMQQALTSRVELLQFGAPGQYRITSTAESPLAASNTANVLTLLVRDNLSEPGNADEPPINVLQLRQVVPAQMSLNLKIRRLWMIAFSMAAISGVLGAVFFFLAFKQSSPATSS